MEPTDYDKMTDDQRNRAKKPLAAWVIVAIFAIYLILLAINAP